MALTSNTSDPLDAETVNEERYGDGSVGSGKTLEQLQADWQLPETPDDGEIWYGKGRPQAGVSIVSTTTDSVEVSGNMFNAGGYSNIDCEYRYAISESGGGFGDYTTVSTVSGTFTGDLSNHTFTGLNADTEYEALIQVRNIHDANAWQTSYSGKQATKQDAPQNVTLTQFGDNGELSWDQPPSGAPNFGYRWEIGTDSGTTTSTTVSSVVCGDEVAQDTSGTVGAQVRAEGVYDDSQYISDTAGFTCTSFCLIEGTQILLSSGDIIPIQELTVEDALQGVIIEGFEDTNDPQELRRWSTKDDLVISGDKALIKQIKPQKIEYTIRLNKGLLEATPMHCQLVKQQGKWKFGRMFQIEEGDTLLTNDGREVPVTSKEYITEQKTVYKLTLKDPVHTFVANGMITHNIK